MNNSALPFIGLMKKAGKLEIGEESVRAAVERGRAYAVLSAADASERSVRSAKGLAEAWDIGYIRLPYTKFELGAMINRGSPGMMAITDPGFAKKLSEKLENNGISDSNIQGLARGGCNK